MTKKMWKTVIAGRELIIETGHLAQQANGAVTIRYGDTQILATAVMSKKASAISGYFPLMVDYEERYYAAGKIKGSRFIKREGRPSDEAILTGRVVDRTIRPLFDSRMRNDVQIVVNAQSFDGENDPDILAITAASTALHISDIPWAGPVAGVRVGIIDGEVVINPTKSQIQESSLNLTLAGTKEYINMIEAGGKEVPEEEVLRAFQAGHEVITQIAQFVESIREETGKEKVDPTYLGIDTSVESLIREIATQEGLENALYGTKAEIGSQTSEAKEKIRKYVIEKLGEANIPENFGEVFEQVIDELADEIVHKNILEKEQRPDGRKLNEVRPISCEVGLLARPHGTGLFTRGETQVLTVTTLGAPGDHQIIDTMEVDQKKHYIHHYNFPAFCVGEVRPMRGPGRREVGHGALAEKALFPVIPLKKDFPYTILLVSEVLSSNGSSSMASVCGSTLSLMHAGVPLKNPVSGIAMGVIIGEGGAYKVLSDIQGAEDHYGDMDFKVAGTTNGITALQMDVKVKGVTLEVLRSALTEAQTGRAFILSKMLETISQPNEELSPYAPKIITMQINPEKIGEVIGPGGKIINEIIDETGVSIDIEDDGSVFITGTDAEKAQQAKSWIEGLTRSVQTGEVFTGKVTRIMNFGAFVEILPGKEGLVHISELALTRVEKVDDVVSLGQEVRVKVIEIDSQGRINLSIKRLLAE